MSHARYDFTVLPTSAYCSKLISSAYSSKSRLRSASKIHGLRANRLDTSGNLIDGVDIILRKLAYVLAGLRMRRNEKCGFKILDLFERVEICLHVI